MSVVLLRFVVVPLVELGSVILSNRRQILFPTVQVFNGLVTIRRPETEPTYPSAVCPIPHFRTAVEGSGQMYPSRLNSDVFWA